MCLAERPKEYVRMEVSGSTSRGSQPNLAAGSDSKDTAESGVKRRFVSLAVRRKPSPLRPTRAAVGDSSSDGPSSKSSVTSTKAPVNTAVMTVRTTGAFASPAAPRMFFSRADFAMISHLCGINVRHGSTHGCGDTASSKTQARKGGATSGSSSAVTVDSMTESVDDLASLRQKRPAGKVQNRRCRGTRRRFGPPSPSHFGSAVAEPIAAQPGTRDASPARPEQRTESTGKSDSASCSASQRAPPSPAAPSTSLEPPPSTPP
mmetsp:Transcript_31202/g.107814  ORF Transcript_31202/g.107814 Transcript_31202/m.107814 type:complete len:262 (-) Transcript_31202:463-1248(-)